jgi:hypothetical protein
VTWSEQAEVEEEAIHGGTEFKKVFGIRAVVGHTAIGFLEYDRLLMPLSYIEDDAFLASRTIQ